MAAVVEGARAPGLSGSKVCTACGVRYAADTLFCPNDGMPVQSASSTRRDRDAEDDPYLGQEISGDIEIRQLVGIGAMGRVYRAFQKSIERDVAVKILHRELSANAQLVSRFTREAKVASRLQHANVVQVLLAGQLPDGALYIVMEYLDGLSLQSALAAAGGVLPLARALHITVQLCDAVGEAHAQGIIHRDLKPENVMLVRRAADPDFVKVLDFGIARVTWGEPSAATAAGLIFGTARYISPEGAQGTAVGPASDAYAIATLLYQMLSGRTPFEGEQAVSVLVSQIHDTPPYLTSIPAAEYVPDAIAEVIMANLAKDPAQREQDAQALGHALVSAARDAGLSEGDISRPHGRRSKGALSSLAPPAKSNSERTPIGATVKWEPPSEFQARLTELVLPEAAAGSTRLRSRPSVDETLDDASNEPPYAGPLATEYTPPLAASEPNRADDATDVPQRRSRGILLIAMCFVLGAVLAAGIAWRMGKIGGDDGEERLVARATDAMLAGHFVDPAGENVRDITAEGLRRFPSARRLVEVRARAANALVTQATRQRAGGDIAEALRLARLASELDANEPNAARLAEQYAAEIATFAAPSTSALPPALPGANTKAPAPAPSLASLSAYNVLLEVSVAQPRPGQNVDLTARVVPAKGPFDDPGFTISGPGVPGGIRVSAQTLSPGTFRGTFAFGEPGRFEILFTAQSDGKALGARRLANVGEPSPRPNAPLGKPSANPTSAPAASVKWM